MKNEKEISINTIIFAIKRWYSYLLSKWPTFLITGVFFATVGVLYAWLQKPVYTAELTFTSENESNGGVGGYAQIAAQFGFDIGGASGSAFAGENLTHLMASRRVIEKTLFTPTEINGAKVLLINHFIKVSGLEKSFAKKHGGKPFFFISGTTPRNRESDSLIQIVFANIRKNLEIDKADKKSDIVSVRYKCEDEIFAKVFVEELVNNVINYYTDYKIKKTKQNVAILQRQTDSVRQLISGNIVDIAVSSDLNVNPTRQIVRTGIQRKQVDAQVNAALYTELVKNLELSKMGLRKETPLVQIIDTPMLPLEKKKMGRLKGAILFGLLAVFLTGVFLIFKKLFI